MISRKENEEDIIESKIQNLSNKSRKAVNTVDVLINCVWSRKVEGRSIGKEGPTPASLMSRVGRS